MTDNELNALIAERVMELRVDPDDCGCTDCLTGQTMNSRTLPDYCNDIAAAWQVAEKMREHFTYLTLQIIRVRIGARFDGTQFAEPIETVWDKTAPRAICLAALKAVGVEVE